MIIKDKEKILNKIRHIKARNREIFFKGLKEYDYSEFTKKLKSVEFVLKCIDEISEGYVFVLKKSIDIKFLEKAKIKLNKFALKNKNKLRKYSLQNLNNLDNFSWNRTTEVLKKKLINLEKSLIKN